MPITENQNVTLNYELKLNDEIIDTNMDKEPIAFVYGSGQIINGLKLGIKDMNEGETKIIKVSPKDAYGELDDENTQTVPKKELEIYLNE